jgi:hypothetical protein
VTLSVLWGRLHESEYFDTIADNDLRLLTGFGLGIQPRGLEDLFIGFIRMYTFSLEDLTVRHFIPFFEPFLKESLATDDNPQGVSPDDQRLSVFFRWLLPASGFEAYGEYAREDHAWDFSDLVQELDHAAAYLVGVRKVHPVGRGRWLDIRGEWVNLQQLRRSRPGVRGTPSFYLHPPQGHTHRGQMLGAGIGPGAESQYLGIDAFTDRATIGGFVERVRRNEMSSVAIAESSVWPPQHDVELTGGINAGRRYGKFDLGGQLSYSYRYNRFWLGDDSNFRVTMNAMWRP